MRDLAVVSDLKLWPPATTDTPGQVLCRGVLRSGSLWIRFAVRRCPSGLVVSYPNRRGKALAWPDPADRVGLDRTILAEARRRGWVR